MVAPRPRFVETIRDVSSTPSWVVSWVSRLEVEENGQGKEGRGENNASSRKDAPTARIVVTRMVVFFFTVNLAHPTRHLFLHLVDPRFQKENRGGNEKCLLLYHLFCDFPLFFKVLLKTPGVSVRIRGTVRELS